MEQTDFINLVIDQKSKYTDDYFTYRTEEPLKPGNIVYVSFGKGSSLKRAFVMETNVRPDPAIRNIKTISEVDREVSLTEEMIRTSVWMRARYGIKYIDCLKCFIPPGKPARAGKEKKPMAEVEEETQIIEGLTEEQEKAMAEIGGAMEEDRFTGFLIHGVTGSGKTEVYMQAVRKALDMGKTAVVLVPEIALTEQIIRRFAARFGKEEVAVLHSKLTQRERFDEWMRLRKGEARIAVGARIGAFAPLQNIGVMILDEEHEATYKSDQTPKYDALDICCKRMMDMKGVLILGSATPSVVSYERARQGIYRLIELKERYNKVPLPEVRIVDMREERKCGNTSPFSRELVEEMRRTLAKKEQVILFLNRRGYHTYIACGSCGESLRCPECGISLVYHKRENAAVCHYCGKKFPPVRECPSCGGTIEYRGSGTEKIEEEIAEFFPDVKTARLDMDTAKGKTEIRKIIRGFETGKTGILIGTQLVAKGLDFRNVGLVGVIAADISLNIPDYRSSERTFQLVTQVSGRAGRGTERGRVIVQSFTPDNFALQAAKDADYEAFFREEKAIRSMLDYPPFTDLLVCEFTSEQEELAQAQAEDCKAWLMKTGLPNADRILNPRISQNFKGEHAYRYQIMVKVPKGKRNEYIYYLMHYQNHMKQQKIPCHLTLDVNPYSTF